MNDFKPTLVEPGVKYFLKETLKQCNEFKNTYHNYIFNISLGALFFFILGLLLLYKYKGKLFKEFPYDLEVLENARPIYKEMPGWIVASNKPKEFKDLAVNARAYLSTLQDILKTKISMVSVGSARQDTIFI